MERVTIIGAGLAGLSAALELAEQNIKTDLISLQVSERAQSNLAEGGINAALDLMGENDTVLEHFSDTMSGGADLADPVAVRGLTENAPDIVRRLASLGVPFNMRGGSMIQRNFGGQKKKRTLYCRSSTGKALMTALIDEARRYEGDLITRHSHHELSELITDGGRCTGVRVRDVYNGESVCFGGPVILAFGGPGGLFPGMTTGTTANSGSALARVFAQGVEAADLEFIQYHPTTVEIPGKRLLISEAARGEGGRLFIGRNGSPWYFMEEKYPELGNLMPRDVVSREIASVLKDPECGDQVFLDMTAVSRDTWKKALPDLRAEIIDHLGIDPAKDPVPVSPGIHYFMGGIRVDSRHRTSVSGLYAAGECACQYHGANRLGGNSMLGAIYGGMVAARSASGYNDDAGADFCGEGSGESGGASPYIVRRTGELLAGAMGITRDGASLREAADALRALRREAEGRADIDRLMLAEAMVESALARRETRGAHMRADCPKRDDFSFMRTTVARRSGDDIVIEFCDIQ